MAMGRVLPAIVRSPPGRLPSPFGATDVLVKVTSSTITVEYGTDFLPGVDYLSASTPALVDDGLRERLVGLARSAGTGCTRRTAHQSAGRLDTAQRARGLGLPVDGVRVESCDPPSEVRWASRPACRLDPIQSAASSDMLVLCMR